MNPRRQVGRGLTILELALKSEPKNMLTALELYRAIKGKNPEDLKRLLETKFQPKDLRGILFDQEFLSIAEKDAQGYPVDPFGQRFYYNPVKGVIYSQTKGYEGW